MVKQCNPEEYEFAIRETKTKEVMDDVITLRSEIGILYLNDFNRKVIQKLLRENSLEFHSLMQCNTYVYLWNGHPLAKKQSIKIEELAEYPCLSFEQGASASLYFAEEPLNTKAYPRIIKANDRATMLNLMVGLNGYTLCSGIICKELNGSEYLAIPFETKDKTFDNKTEIGYIVKKNQVLSDMGILYIEALQKYLQNQKP